MSLQQLAYLVALADARSFTSAADAVGVAQPTLSRQLRVLEAELGAELVQRGSRDGITLTAAGEVVLPLARRMLADMDAARTGVAELIGLRRGRVRVGATPSLCIGVLADVLRVFHDRHPEVRLELVNKSRMKGRIEVGKYLHNYDRVEDWHLVPALAVEVLRKAVKGGGRRGGRRRRSQGESLGPSW